MHLPRSTVLFSLNAKSKHDFILFSFLNLIKYNLSNTNGNRCGLEAKKKQPRKVRAFKFVPWHK